MTVSEAKELFRELTQSYFPDYMVVFANQSRTPKPELPLVTLAPGNLHRPLAANTDFNREDGMAVGYYLSRLPIVVDLFTNGKPITEDDEVVAYENTALDELLGFADYMNSIPGVDWCQRHNVSILLESDAQDITGMVNDSHYEYRARLEVLFYFTHHAGPVDLGQFETVTIEEES